jgi:hypothetical protein
MRQEGISMSPRISSSNPSCVEKARLINNVLEAHKTIASIQIQRMEAVVSASGEADPRLHVELKRARDSRRSLMEELRQHIEEHRC